jgi:hypothetical protein
MLKAVALCKAWADFYFHGASSKLNKASLYLESRLPYKNRFRFAHPGLSG